MALVARGNLFFFKPEQEGRTIIWRTMRSTRLSLVIGNELPSACRHRGNRWRASSPMSFIEATFESFTEFAPRIGVQNGIGVGISGGKTCFAAANADYYLKFTWEVDFIDIVVHIDSVPKYNSLNYILLYISVACYNIRAKICQSILLK